MSSIRLADGTEIAFDRTARSVTLRLPVGADLSAAEQAYARLRVLAMMRAVTARGPRLEPGAAVKEAARAAMAGLDAIRPELARFDRDGLMLDAMNALRDAMRDAGLVPANGKE